MFNRSALGKQLEAQERYQQLLKEVQYSRLAEIVQANPPSGKPTFRAVLLHIAHLIQLWHWWPR